MPNRPAFPFVNQSMAFPKKSSDDSSAPSAGPSGDDGKPARSRARKPKDPTKKSAMGKPAKLETSAPADGAGTDRTSSDASPPGDPGSRTLGPSAEATPPAPVAEKAPRADQNTARDSSTPPQKPNPNTGGRADWSGPQASERNERGYWKHGKRKRGRHGGHWQQGGGPREQHPPQPPPPFSVTVSGELPDPGRFKDLAALDALARELGEGTGEPLLLHRLYALPLAELTPTVRELGIDFDGAPNRRQALGGIFKFADTSRRPLRDCGYIDVTDRGAFIVHEHVNYRLYPEDSYLPAGLMTRYGLKRGHQVEVTVQAPREGERCPSVIRIDTVMGGPPDAIARVTPFEELVPYYPLQRILLEAPEVHTKDVSMRAVDILTPIGFGQRGLIVAPPRTGKTILLQNIANSISANSPEVKLILLLIDERPEEVTDFRRHTHGEVVSSTFDESPESHVHCAEMVIENARRRIEQGEHVVILLDSITRLARAYNALSGNSGKIMSGGLEATALQKPKRFFGSARNIEGGGSLTIIASALVDTGSRMDEIIFEEFKGTGNSELHLDRGLVERRIFPAINIDRSGTRKEELIYHPDELQRIYGLRRAMQGLGPLESMEMLITRLRKTKSNAEFLLSLAPK